MFRCVIQGDPVSVSSCIILMLLLLLPVVAVSQPSVLVTVVKSIVVLFHGWGWVRWRMWCTVIAINSGRCLLSFTNGVVAMVAVIVLAVVVIARCDSVVDSVVKMLQLLVLVLRLVVGRRN